MVIREYVREENVMLLDHHHYLLAVLGRGVAEGSWALVQNLSLGPKLSSMYDSRTYNDSIEPINNTVVQLANNTTIQGATYILPSYGYQTNPTILRPPVPIIPLHKDQIILLYR